MLVSGCHRRAWLRPALVVAALGAAVACSGRSSGGRRDAAVTIDAAPPALAIAVQPLGKASLDGFGWRTGAGAAAFTRALAAEQAGDLPGVERAAAEALAADAGHLEAAWLVAVARARLGRLDGVLAPLEVAAAGDWAKWGERSLELNALAAFRATPAGRGWVAAAEDYRAAVAAHLADAVVVIGGRAGASGGVGRELYAVDPEAGRWLRLTRSGGIVVAALPADGAPQVAYLTATRGPRGWAKVGVGVIELATGRASREVSFADVRGLTLAWRRTDGELVLEAQVPGAGRARTAFTIDWRHGKKAALAKPSAPRGDRLELGATGAARRRLPIAGLTADWDDRGTASAVRLERSGKVVTEPGGALIDGESAALSPDRARLVFATALEPPCEDDDARQLVVAEVGTGRLRTLARGAVGAPAWIDDDRLAFVDGDAVVVAAAATGKRLATVEGGAGVQTLAAGPRRRCDAEPAPFVDVGPPEADVDLGDSDDDPVAPDAGVAPDAAATPVDAAR